MKNLKTLFFSRFNTIALLGVSLLISVFILMVRIKITRTFELTFLVWNLFLAFIPYVITIYLKSLENLGKLKLAIVFVAWLLFLPNAPYIITDLTHIRWTLDSMFWIDTLMICSFAYSGLLCFFLSVLDMKSLLKRYISKKKLSLITIGIFALTGFGVYLGRFLRYNSWEVIQSPANLFRDIISIIIYPTQHIEAWSFTILFSVFLYIGYWTIKTFIT